MGQIRNTNIEIRNKFEIIMTKIQNITGSFGGLHQMGQIRNTNIEIRNKFEIIMTKIQNITASFGGLHQMGQIRNTNIEIRNKFEIRTAKIQNIIASFGGLHQICTSILGLPGPVFFVQFPIQRYHPDRAEGANSDFPWLPFEKS